MLPSSCARAPPPAGRSVTLMLSAIAPILGSLALTLTLARGPRAAHHRRRRLRSILSVPLALFWTTAASDDAAEDQEEEETPHASAYGNDDPLVIMDPGADFFGGG